MTKGYHQDVANLVVSKENIRVGYVEDDETVYIQTEGQTEPTYMSPEEAEMIIPALKVAINKCRGEE